MVGATIINSNTSHVLIYPKLYSITLLDIIRFKYISCSYLSQRKTKLIEIRNHSNTSHVLIYLISHYDRKRGVSDSNTSHVLIYQGKVPGISGNVDNSNTSHVLIYLRS